MDGILAGEPWRRDPSLIPIPWRKELSLKPDKPLKIGYYISDKVIRVQPPIEKAMQTVIDSLKAAGHTRKCCLRYHWRHAFLRELCADMRQ